MRIGHVIYRYKPLVGGAEIYLYQLFKILKEAGHSQRVYQRDNSIRSPEIKSVPKLTRRLPKLIAFNLGLPFQYHNLRKEDLIIINYPEHYPPVAWHKNTIVVSHGSSWTFLERKWMNKIRKRVACYAFNHAGQYVCNDTFVLQELGINVSPQQKMFQEVSLNKWFIPNCVDVNYFKKTNGIADLKRLNPILVPRNLTSSRGIDLAILAFALFQRKYHSTNLVIVGEAIKDMPSSIEYKDRLNNLINELNLENKVYFYGIVKRESMPDIYSSALLTLIPTRCSEGTSFSALESMSCGTATISTNVEGLLDLPTVHCKANEQDLADKMIKVFEKRKQVGQEQQEKVKNTYNLNNWRRTWLEVIKKAERKIGK
ncbi:MAG: glycosyltransferase family 4 protein [Actinomycetota bacterium]|nr:glycosyltransferase family 4 protein [Actinomycetota bacterium]